MTIRGNGTLNLTGYTHAIWVWENITIEGNVAVHAESTSDIAIANNDSAGKITLTGNAKVTAAGGTYGIGYSNSNTNTPKISCSSATISGETAAFKQAPVVASGLPVDAGNDAASAGSVTTITNQKYVRIGGCSHHFADGQCTECGYQCPHSDVENGKCTECGMEFQAQVTSGNSTTYYTTIQGALTHAPAGSTVKIITKQRPFSLPENVYADTPTEGITLDLNGRSVAGYALNVGGTNHTGKLIVIDSSGGNGAIGLTVRSGGDIAFRGGVATSCLQLQVYGGTVKFYGGNIHSFDLYNGVTYADFLPEGYSYYRYSGSGSDLGSILKTADVPNGVYVAVAPCNHPGVTDDGKCEYCGLKMAAKWVSGGKTTGYTSLKEAAAAINEQKPSGGTLTLLADADLVENGHTQNIYFKNCTLTVDQNGHSITNGSLVSSNAANLTIKNSGNGGKLQYVNVLEGTLTIEQNVHVAELMIEQAAGTMHLKGGTFDAISFQEGKKRRDVLGIGYGFKKDGAWVTDLDSAADLKTVTVEPLPLYIAGKPSGTNFTVPYGSECDALTFAFGTADNAEDPQITVTFTIDNRDAGYRIEHKTAELGNMIDGLSVGTHTFSFTAEYNNYTVASETYTITVVQSGAGLTAETYKGNTQTSNFTYGDTINIVCEVCSNGTAAQSINVMNADEETERIEIYKGEALLATAMNDGTGYFDASVDSRRIGAGPHTLTVKYTGNGNMAATETPVSVTVNKATPVIYPQQYANTRVYTGKPMENPTPGTNMVVLFASDSDIAGYKWYTATKNGGNYDKGTALESPPTNAGDYYLEVVFKEGANTTAATLGTGLTVKQLEGTVLTSQACRMYANRAHTYTVNVADYLGNLSLGDNAVYELKDKNSGDYFFEGGQAAITLSADGILTLPLKAVDKQQPTNSIGSLKIWVTSQNYNWITLTLPLEIVDKPTQPLSVTMDSWTYGETASAPQYAAPAATTATVTYAKKNADGSYTDIAVKPSDAGDYKVTVKCETNDAVYAGSDTFSIAPKSLAGAQIVLPTFTYDSNERSIADSVSVKLNNTALTKDTDFCLTGTIDATDAGTYDVQIEGIGNYTDCAAAQWRIDPLAVSFDGSNANAVATVGKATYDGTPREPAVTVTCLNKTLVLGQDYTLEYTNNVNVKDDSKVKITMKGNFSGEAVTGFFIAQADQVINGETVSAVYGENGRKLAVAGAKGTLTYAIKQGSEGIIDVAADGTLTFKKAGTATVLATAVETDNYKRSNTAEVQVNVSKAKVTIKAMDKSAYIGDSKPSLNDPKENTDYRITGLLGNDKLEGITISLAYASEPDMSREGTTAIEPRVSGEDARYDFTCEPGALTVSRRQSTGGSSGGSKTTYPVDVPNVAHGTVTVSLKNAAKGTTVTITIKPDDGYQLDTVTVADNKGNTVKTTDKGDGKYTFPMPAGKVTITPTFTKTADSTPSSDGYIDVASSAWYHDAVDYVTEKGLMSSTGGSRFSPNVSTTRGMLMTVLARHAGADTSNSTPWYQKGMEWAMANGVSDGTHPEVNITREQLATMLYRYAGSPAATGSLESFSDAADVSSYAVDAMCWAAANGIIKGSDGKLNPRNYASRAEVAAIFMRFCETSK